MSSPLPPLELLELKRWNTPAIYNPRAWDECRRYGASQPRPKVVVMQDLDKPHIYGSFWGEVKRNLRRALGCVEVIVEGAIRDLDEITERLREGARRFNADALARFDKRGEW